MMFCHANSENRCTLANTTVLHKEGIISFFLGIDQEEEEAQSDLSGMGKVP